MTAPSEALLPFLNERIANNRYTLACREPFEEWQNELRDIWRAGLPPSGDPRSEVLEERGRFRHLRFHYATGDCGEAVLLLPEGDGPYPAILLMHDHGGVFNIGWQKVVCCDAGRDHATQHYDGRFLADDLVEQGYAVLVCDALGWGSRFAGGYAEQQALAAQVMQAGWNLAGLVAADDLAAFCWLSRQPEIDSARIGTLGFSFGGFRSWQLAALEQRVRACSALSWAGTRQALLAPGSTLLKGQSAFYTLHPHLAMHADFPHMAALAADRPLFMRIGSLDCHFPTDSAQHFFDILKQAGSTTGTLPNTDIFSGDHCLPSTVQETAIDFLDSALFCEARAFSLPEV
ncbi:MAG: dienelactone hydrolase family protein [Pararhizobium sp.]